MCTANGKVYINKKITNDLWNEAKNKQTAMTIIADGSIGLYTMDALLPGKSKASANDENSALY